MSTARRHRAEAANGSRTAGFSLAEVLVALAIAAMMTAMLTRFVAGTRMGAVKVAESTEMAALGETLLARIASSQHLRPGQTDGRAGGFSWRIDIAPLAFEARALAVSEAPATNGDALPASGFGDASRPDAAAGTATAMASMRRSWAAYRVAVLIRAPSGHSHAIETVMLGPGGSDEP